MNLRFVCNYKDKSGSPQTYSFEGCTYNTVKSVMDGALYRFEELVGDPSIKSVIDELFERLNTPNNCTNISIGIMLNDTKRVNICSLPKISTITLNVHVDESKSVDGVVFTKTLEIR